jgi:hypothetical protein
MRCAASAGEPDRSSQQVQARFRETVRPFLEAYCLRCHGPQKPKGDIDLSVFKSADDVTSDLARWEGVLEQLEAGSMPPAKAKPRPSAAKRETVIAWISALRELEARRNAGDPGPVRARRLSNAEYDNTIRDLTGVDMRPTNEFPVDPANEAGFDNSSESLTMSPALVKKYLEAARNVADHIVLTLDGFNFAPYPALADTDRDKYCVQRIIEFYKRQKIDYADYFLAAWRFKHRVSAGKPEQTLDRFADELGLSRKYLATIWTTVEGTSEDIGPLAALRTFWDELPASPAGGDEAVRAACRRMGDFVVTLRARLVPEVKNLTAPRISAGTQPFVLWKNRQYAANRMRYAGGGATLKTNDLGLSCAGVCALEEPESPERRARYEAAFRRFCRTFPDAFYVSERARVYLKNEDKNNTGRLLSAGFHSMTGYFRDDGPLYELVLDEAGQKELDLLWQEFDFITDAPLRQYLSYLWYERAETGFLRGDPDFNFVRAEDRDAASETKMGRFAQVYLAKARRLKAGDVALRAIEDQFRIIGETVRRVERERREAEPQHLKAIQRFAERAFRHPLSSDERRDLVRFYEILRKEDGLSHEDAVHDTVVSILMSPRFLYRVDLTGEGGRGSVRPLSDYDLASRMSYFLWASMPDRELLEHAAAGDLHEPEELARQARRMLKDGRVRGMAEEFAGNWLDFRRFQEHNSVDRNRFPAFDDDLRRSMFEEPVRFFLDVVQNDRPVELFLSGKHTFVNGPLARHYGMPAPPGKGDEWRRIDDATRYGRGGLMPMAVFLTKNSPGLRTSPVKRGYWVVKRLLGENIPAPPPNVPDLPDDESKLGERTLRETLVRHRADQACAGCHERFDPIGLAFEGYGPVGEAREVDLAGHPVDTRASFPRGGEGSGVEGLRTYLETTRRHEFVDNLCRKLLAFGLGRSLITSDDPTIEAMRERLNAEGGRFGALVEVIVTSPQFRYKRLESNPSE